MDNLIINSTAKKQNMNIGLDLDGVIVDHTENIRRVARELGFDASGKYSSIHTLKKIMPEDLHYDLKKAIYGKMSLKAKPMAYAKNSIEKLSASGHTLSIVSRRDHDKDYALSWLKVQGILEHIPERRIIFVGDDKYKAVEAKRLKSDIFLDDKIEVLFFIKSVAYPVLFNRFGLDLNEDKYEEVRSWGEFLKLVKNFTL